MHSQFLPVEEKPKFYTQLRQVTGGNKTIFYNIHTSIHTNAFNGYNNGRQQRLIKGKQERSQVTKL